jgi:hypothetical protein
VAISPEALPPQTIIFEPDQTAVTDPGEGAATVLVGVHVS